jgi:hypothetical protein
MTPKIIRNKLAKLDEKLHIIYKKITDLQNLCPHENFEKKYCGDSGNYDPSNDSYWIDWKCIDCNKRFSTDQIHPFTYNPATRKNGTMKEAEIVLEQLRQLDGKQ